MVLDRIPRIQRRTSSVFELALAVLFTSGIQHYAEIPEGMAKTPDWIRKFLRNIPEVWEDVKFIDGYPGKYVVMARRGKTHWYIVGINGESTPRDLVLDLGEARNHGQGMLVVDGANGNLSFSAKIVDLEVGQKFQTTLPPQGGFVLVTW
jgi:alpha-glucosidase